MGCPGASAQDFPSPSMGIGARLRDSESQLWLYNRILDSRFRGNDAPVVMPAKAGIQSFACEPWLILAPMPVKGEGKFGSEGEAR